MSFKAYYILLTHRPHTARHKPSIMSPSEAGYKMLWATYGLDAYNNVVAHSGPISDDIKRLRNYADSRVKGIQTELAVIANNTSNATEVVNKEQMFSAKLLREVHKSGMHEEALLKKAVPPLE